MLVNVCMIAKDRPRLTQQALESLFNNTPSSLFNLTVVDDDSHEIEMGGRIISGSPQNFVESWAGHRPNSIAVRLSRSKGIVGFARNFAIRAAEQYWGRGDFLYLSDNDVVFLPGWLEAMTGCLSRNEDDRILVLGGVRHPFHGVNLNVPTMTRKIELTDAVAGYSHLMRWETWDKYGPFDAHAQGVCQSEDFAFCQKIVKDGGYVGYIDPPVLVNCGLTNSEGKPAVGSEAFPRVPGIIQE